MLSLGADCVSCSSSDKSDEYDSVLDMATAHTVDNGPSRGYYGTRGKGNGIHLPNPRENLARAFPTTCSFG